VDFRSQPVSKALQPFLRSLAVLYTSYDTEMASVLEAISNKQFFLYHEGPTNMQFSCLKDKLVLEMIQ